MAIDFGALETLPEGAVRFFLTFTRFEFALKDQRYVIADPRDGATIADWNRFANELGADFGFVFIGFVAAVLALF